MADIFRHLTIANLLPYKISYGFSEGTVRRRAPPNGDGMPSGMYRPASGLFAAGGCGVPVPQAFMGIGKTQKGLPVPPRLLHRFTGSPETFCGALLNAAIDTPTRANGRKPAKKRSPYSPGRRGTRGTHYQVGNIRSYLFNNITVYSFFLQSPRKRFSGPACLLPPCFRIGCFERSKPGGPCANGPPLAPIPTVIRVKATTPTTPNATCSYPCVDT